MKKIINAPERYVEDMLEGIYAAYPDRVKYAADDVNSHPDPDTRRGVAGYYVILGLSGYLSA